MMSETDMALAVVSPKFQIAIPKKIPERLHLKHGQSVALIERDGLVTLVPQRPIAELRDMARGMSYEGYRDETDRI